MKGYCGLDCERCECYIATIENDDIKKMNLAIKWSKLFKRSILPREIYCTGCKSEKKKFFNCHSCKIKKEIKQSGPA